MSVADDLKAADTTIKGAVDALIAEIERLLAKLATTSGSVSDADAAAVTTDLTTAASAASAEVAKSQAAAP